MNKKESRMVHVQVPEEVRETLIILKKKVKGSRFGDIMLEVLQAHFPDEVEIAKKRVDLKRQLKELGG